MVRHFMYIIFTTHNSNNIKQILIPTTYHKIKVPKLRHQPNIIELESCRHKVQVRNQILWLLSIQY